MSEDIEEYDEDREHSDDDTNGVWIKFCPYCGSDLRQADPGELSVWFDYSARVHRAQVRCDLCNANMDIRLNNPQRSGDSDRREEGISERQLHGRRRRKLRDLREQERNSQELS